LRALGDASRAAMNPMTATCFILAGISLILSSATHAAALLLARANAWLIAFVGLSKIASAFAGLTTGIDTLLFREAMAATADGRSNQMAPAAAACFVLLGAGLILVRRRDRLGDTIAQVCAIVSLLVALVALMAHAYRTGWFEGVGLFSRMALHTAIALATLSLGVLSTRSNHGIIAVLTSEGPGGTLARSLLPAGLLIPPVLGWFVLLGRREGILDPALVEMFFVLGTTLLFAVLVSWNATQLQHSHQDRQSAEIALRDSEVRFRLLAENMSDVISLYDLEGNVIYVSASCERVLGFTPDEVAGMKSFALVHADDYPIMKANAAALMRGEPVTATQFRVMHKTGRIIWVETMWRAVRNRDGAIVRLQASSRDITERKGYERELEETRHALQAQQDALLTANERLETLATMDGLTGLKNRRAFEERLHEEIARARRNSSPLSLLLIDIDHFKQFNDSFGHPRGDEVLRIVARILSRTMRDTDFATRYGGEEFAVILPDTDRDGAQQMGERLRYAVATAAWEQRPITISVGASMLTRDVVSAESLVELADRALYRSKERGRNLVTLTDAA